jgi:hypothetical protein
MTKAKKTDKQVVRPARGQKRAPAGRTAHTRSAGDVTPAPAPDSTGGDISYGTLSLHQLFEQQTRQMLDRTDLDEEQKQNILVALNCPCCGTGGLSYTAKLKR